MDIHTAGTCSPAQARARDLAARIEHDINVGRFGIGAWLKQIDLERLYGCTRHDLRQALDRLAEKGLVRQVPNRGYQVEDMDPARLADIMKIRAILEVAAAEEVIARMDEAGLAAMQRAAEEFERALTDGTMDQQEASNRAFHRAMLQYCPNRELVALLFDLRGRVPLAVTRQRNTLAVMQRSARQHFEMIEHLRARNLPELQRVLREHNLNSTMPAGGAEAPR